jgi:hypothetical protein
MRMRNAWRALLRLMSLEAALPLVAALALSQAARPAETAVRPWDVFEVELTASAETVALPENSPPVARVVFRNGSNAVTVAAFWDGGRKWRARFAPPSPGEWQYRSESADSGMGGRTGRFLCEAWSDEEKRANPTRHGFVRAVPGRHYFEYTDGTPFLWIGDTWWNWSKRGIHFETFRKLADDRADKGFTVGQLYFPGQGALLDARGTRPDFDQIRRVEEMIAYANSRGITVWIHPWWGSRYLNRRPGPALLRRWWRYCLNRLGAYNVIWTLAGEYNMYDYGGLGLDFWKDLGTMIQREDPWTRLIGAHPTPPGWPGGAGAPQWSTGEVLHAESWLSYNQSQVGHSKWRNEMIPVVVTADYARIPAKPVVVTEPWYEFVDGNPSPEDIRFGAWSAILSGAAGHTYGGGHVWWAHVPEAPSSQDPWPLHKQFDTDTLNYPGAVSVGFLARFLKSLEWWRLAPHPELVFGYPSRFCRADPGSEYIVYVRWSGTLQLDLRPSSEKDTFGFTWTDLGEERQKKSGTINGGGLREFRSPEDYPSHPHYKDWLLHVRHLAP